MKNKSLKKVLLLICIIFFLNACFNKSNEEKDIANGVNVKRDGEILRVYAKENILGAEISIG